MKKLHKLAAAVAVAAGIALSPQSQAIELETNGVGDALLFPVFAAGTGLYENYFTISNSSADWIQGHLRFRGAAWSAELLDFDVILSPGDVFVFRLADVDGDGMWEVDGSLDPKNFQYTGMVFPCTGPSGTFNYCIDSSNMLEPDNAGIAEAKKAGLDNIEEQRDRQRRYGYVEFIGEAVLEGMTPNIMSVLTSDVPGVWQPYVTGNGNRKGTNTWRWSDAEGGFRSCAASTPCDRGLRDVANVLSGTAFLTLPGQVSGVAYNAEALIDFRTIDHAHRLENYDRRNTLAANAAANFGLANLPPQNAVILHHESAASDPAAASPAGDYVYGCCTTTDENRTDERVISFNNTWGPTLADGDDYLPTDNILNGVSVIPGLPSVAGSTANVGAGRDAFDIVRSSISYQPIQNGPNVWANPATNSVTEVEMAIRNSSVGQNVVFYPLANSIRGQMFTSYYSDADLFDKSGAAKGNLNSNFVGFFPTKFFIVGEVRALPLITAAGATHQGVINGAVIAMLQNAKPIKVQLWDLFENSCTCTNTAISPAVSKNCDHVLGQELSAWDMKFLKKPFTNYECTNPLFYKAGRTEIWLETRTTPAPLVIHGGDGYPGLLYTYDKTDTGNIAHWRSMQKR